MSPFWSTLVSLPDPSLRNLNCIDRWQRSLQHVVKWTKRAKALIGEPPKSWRMEVSCWKETMSALPDKMCNGVPFRIVMPPWRIKMELEEYTPLNHTSIAERIRPQGTNGHWKYASRFHCPQLHLVKSYQILGADFNEEIFSEENDVVKRWTIASFSIRNHPLFGGFAEEERARKSTMPKSSSKSPRGCESERVLLAIGKSSGNGTTVARKRQRCCRFRKNKTTMALFAPFDTTN